MFWRCRAVASSAEVPLLYGRIRAQHLTGTMLSGATNVLLVEAVTSDRNVQLRNHARYFMPLEAILK